jgi:hypothetical protein
MFTTVSKMSEVSGRQRKITDQSRRSNKGIRYACAILASNFPTTPGDGKAQINVSEQCKQLTNLRSLSLLAHLRGGEFRNGDNGEIARLLTGFESFEILAGRIIAAQVVNQNVTIKKDLIHQTVARQGDCPTRHAGCQYTLALEGRLRHKPKLASTGLLACFSTITRCFSIVITITSPRLRPKRSLTSTGNSIWSGSSIFNMLIRLSLYLKAVATRKHHERSHDI